MEEDKKRILPNQIELDSGCKYEYMNIKEKKHYFFYTSPGKQKNFVHIYKIN